MRDISNALRYDEVMIRSFRDKQTRQVFEGKTARKLPPEIQRTAERKLKMIHAATELNSLRIPPANRLEKLSGSRTGQHSIRINDQWRICLIWRDGDAYDVEIADYH